MSERVADLRFSALYRVYVTIGTSPASACAVCCVVISLALSACTSTRPVVKIGLLAPFEGLHRESGYEALAAMRAALADYPLADVEALPLALDTSADPAQARRAAQKLLRDQSVAAVIGPLQPQQVVAVADIIAASDVDWRVPTTPASAERAQALVAAFISEIDGQAVLVAGLGAPWPQLAAQEWSAQTGKTVSVADEVEAPVDGILWLGDAPGGAAFLARLRLQNRTVPFWTMSVGGDPVFSSLLRGQLGGVSPGPVYWGIAVDDSVTAGQYSEWAAAHRPASPLAYAVYQATRRALERIAGNGPHSGRQRLAIFTLDREGNNELAQIVPFP